MTRAKWKGPYVDPTLFNEINSNQTKEIKITQRSSEILLNFVGKSFAIYTGNSYTIINVSEEMVGHKFGEFAFTRKRYVFKKKSNNK